MDQLSIIINNSSNIPEWIAAIGTSLSASAAILISLGLMQELAPLKLKVFSGDKLDIVVSSDATIHKVHLLATFSNNGYKNAQIRKVALLIGDGQYVLNWSLFVKPAPDGESKLPLRRPGPFVVPRLKSKSFDIQFWSKREIRLPEGEYRCWICVWSNVEKLTPQPTHVHSFTLAVTPENRNRILTAQRTASARKQAIMESLDIKEWKLHR